MSSHITHIRCVHDVISHIQIILCSFSRPDLDVDDWCAHQDMGMCAWCDRYAVRQIDSSSFNLHMDTGVRHLMFTSRYVGQVMSRFHFTICMHEFNQMIWWANTWASLIISSPYTPPAAPSSLITTVCFGLACVWGWLRCLVMFELRWCLRALNKQAKFENEVWQICCHVCYQHNPDETAPLDVRYASGIVMTWVSTACQMIDVRLTLDQMSSFQPYEWWLSDIAHDELCDVLFAFTLRLCLMSVMILCQIHSLCMVELVW